MHEVYCATSGYTGTSLLTPEPAFFVACNLVIDPDSARALVARLPPHTGPSLLASSDGQAAVLALLPSCLPASTLVTVEKTLALTEQCYDYLLAPILAPAEALFDDLRFHRFISTVLAAFLMAEDTNVSDFLHAFELAVQHQDVQALLLKLAAIKRRRTVTPVLKQLATLCLGHQHAIIDAWQGRPYHDLGRWLLHVAAVGLQRLLIALGDEEEIQLWGDVAQPFLLQWYDGHASDPPPMTAEGTPALTLVEPDQLPGLRLAQVCATAVAFALAHPDTAFSQACVEIGQRAVGHIGAHLNLDDARLTSQQGFVNLSLLDHLVARTQKRQELLSQVPAARAAALRAYQAQQQRTPKR